MASKGTCKAEQCEKEVRAKGYCPRHYKLWRSGKMPKPRYKSCNAENCLKPQEGRGLCAEHLAKARAKGKGGTEEAAAAS
jgi:hypothetical protein